MLVLVLLLLVHIILAVYIEALVHLLAESLVNFLLVSIVVHLLLVKGFELVKIHSLGVLAFKDKRPSRSTSIHRDMGAE